jgi:tRNA/rRNA methyltransferase/tRNA (cytidine32/uridine32-2'-O)-methyltransferase
MSDIPLVFEPSTLLSLRVKVVLVEPQHPGNIGAVARAMKNMCLTELVLVSPQNFPSPVATARASGADDLLQSATVVSTLDEALESCRLVLGTTARPRELRSKVVNPRVAARQLVEHGQNADVAILFGRENSGLTNEELERCQSIVGIPANPEYSSLNIAAAAQVLCYEILCARLEEFEALEEEQEYATGGELEGFFAHLEEMLLHTAFYNPENPRHLMRQMRSIFDRGNLRSSEVNLLRGLCKSVLALPASPFAKMPK